MNILLICDYYYPHTGGVERLFEDLAHHLLNKGHHITLLTSRHEPILATQELWKTYGDHTTNTRDSNQNTITIHRIGGKSRRSILGAGLLRGRRHRHYLRSCDLIHSSTFVSVLVGCRYSRLYSLRHSIIIHEVYFTQRYRLKGLWGLLYIIYEYILCRRLVYDYCITPSYHTRHRIHQYYSHRPITVIYNEIDYEYRHPHFSATIVRNSLLFVGRLSPEKGLLELLKAVDLLISRDIIVSVTIVSRKKGHYYRRIHDFVQEKKLEHIISWIDNTPSQDELRELMRTHHLGIVPSRSEGFGYTAVQMEATGMRMVVHNNTCFSEILDHKHTQVDVFDAHAFAQAIHSQLMQTILHHQHCPQRFVNCLDEYYQLRSPNPLTPNHQSDDQSLSNHNSIDPKETSY